MPAGLLDVGLLVSTPPPSGWASQALACGSHQAQLVSEPLSSLCPLPGMSFSQLCVLLQILL